MSKPSSDRPQRGYEQSCRSAIHLSFGLGLPVAGILTAFAVGIAMPAQALAAEDLGPHTLQNASNRLCLGIPDGAVGAVTSAQVRPCTHDASQKVIKPRRWRVLNVGDGKLSIRHFNANLCLNLKKSQDNREGGPVKAVGCSSHPDQLWEADYRLGPQSNQVSLRNVATRKCLSLPRGRSNRSNKGVTVHSCANRPDQLWALVHMAFESAHYRNGVTPLTLNHPVLPGRTNFSVVRDGSLIIADGDMLVAKKTGRGVRVAAPAPRVFSRFRLPGPTCRGPVCSNENSLSTPQNVSLWPGGVIPFNIGCSSGTGTVPTITELGRIQQATSFLTRETLLTFRPAVGREDQITFCKIRTSAGGLSAVGRQGGTQTIFLSNASNARMRTIYHELLHAIGFVHEHQRADRDSYLRVNMSNVQPRWRNAFELRENLIDVTPYDIGSVMHYPGFTGFEIDASRPAITDRAGNPIVTASRPTRYDLDAIDILYNTTAGRGSWPDLNAHRLLTLVVSNVQSDDRDGGAKREIDFYSKVEMGGGRTWRPGNDRNPTRRFKSSTLEDYDNNLNPNWSFTVPIQIGERFARIVFQLRDDDGSSRWERTDEDIDIHPLPGIKHLEFVVDMRTRDIFLAGIDGQYTSADLVGNGANFVTIQRGTEGSIRAETTVSILVAGP